MSKPNLSNRTEWKVKRTSAPKVIGIIQPIKIPVPDAPGGLVKVIVNLGAILFLAMAGYFLYCIYLERVVVTDYVNYIRSQTIPPGPIAAGNQLMSSKNSLWDL